MRIGAVVALLVGNGCALAQPPSEMSIRVGATACEKPEAMQLWESSGASPLIRRGLLEKNLCWAAPSGLKVFALEQVGDYFVVHYPGNTRRFFVHRSKLAKWVAKEEDRPTSLKPITNRVKFLRVSNSSEFGVELRNGKPTFLLEFNGMRGSRVYFGFAKEYVKNGFSAQVTQESGSSPDLLAGGKAEGTYLTVKDSGAFARVQIVELNSKTRTAKVEVEASFAQTKTGGGPHYVIPSTTVSITGHQFDELIRPHSAQELSKTIGK
ncbi:UNVERIFIED_ORG: hypothetical protein LHJ69_04385 [Shinella sp. XGS7]|nr:hypothetical protein [Shinella sp. XGS7]